MSYRKFIFYFLLMLTGNVLTSAPLNEKARERTIQAQCCEHSLDETNTPVLHRCGSTLYRQLEESRHPHLREARENIERQTERWLSRNSLQLKSTQEVVTIPVVVHVVYNPNQPEQNISRQQILSQLNALNRDFRRWNEDTVHTPSMFKNLAADTRIEFQLARRTPEGLPTTGITRRATNIVRFTMDSDNVKFSNTGGTGIWNRDQYLNIWVCNLEQDYLGYAQYPGGRADTDGIVISYRSFGTEGTAQFPYNLGRTLTHETGHWFNLMHTWGDEDICGATDYVADTPDQELPYYHCPSFPQESCDSEDMFMNYMDYTDDRCMNIFTTGQANRMQATLNGFRAPLKSSPALQAPQENIISCDTMQKELINKQLHLYKAHHGGYITGTQTLAYRAMAQYFENPTEAGWLTAGGVAFGAAHDKGGIASLAIWATDFSGKPVNPPLARTDLPIATIQQDVENDRITWFQFDTPVRITGPFFAGIILPVATGDSLALLATPPVHTSHAWAQAGNSSWHNFRDIHNDSLNIKLAIFPIACIESDTEELTQDIGFTIGPNPNTGQQLNMYFTNLPPDTRADIEIFDISGRRVMHKQNIHISHYMPLNISSLTMQGIFFIRVSNAHLNVRKKFLLIPNS